MPAAKPAPTQVSKPAVAAPPAVKAQFEPLTAADEADLDVRPPRRYVTGLLFLLLVVCVLFGIQYLFVEDGERMTSRRTPVSIAQALPSATTVLGATPTDAEAPPTSAPKLGIVRVESEPPGARVVVNGNLLNSPTPTSIQTLADQKSTVRVLLAGYLPFESRVDVPQAGADVKATLQKGKPDLAKLHVESSPNGAIVSINGNPVGNTPLTLEKVGAGVELTMRLDLKGYYTHGVLFTLRKDESREIGINLLPDTGPKDIAIVNVESIPLGATVYDALHEGGKKPEGKTGNYPLKLTRTKDASVRLRAELTGKGDAVSDLDLKLPYYTVFMRLNTPQETFGTLTVLGAPGITIYAGTQELGVTPLKKAKVPTGEQSLVLLDMASGKRSEAKVQVVQDKDLEKKVVLTDGTPGLQ